MFTSFTAVLPHVAVPRLALVVMLATLCELSIDGSRCPRATDVIYSSQVFVVLVGCGFIVY